MKAVTFEGQHKMAVTTQPKPKIKQPTDAILRVTTTGICGSDLHMYDGRTALDKGTVVGHEIMGVIDEVDNSGTIHSPQNFVGNYNVGATGRGTMSTNSPIGIPANVILYIVSQSSFRAISGDSNPSNGHPLVFYFDH